MSKWQNVVVHPDTPLSEVVRRIQNSGLQISLVVDEAGRLIGTVTDGDIRRTLIRGLGMESPIRETMNRSPRTLPADTSADVVLAYMRQNRFHHVPLVDGEGKVVDVRFVDELIGAVELPNMVLVMAGGPGTRLRPLTDLCPKPLLQVGGKPILERIVERFAEQGFRRFYFSVNYKASMIVDYFGDGSRWGINIEYLHESDRLGTAGALSLLQQRPEHPIMVMNGDLLTEASFPAMLREHERHGALGTMAVREYEMHIPYGVVSLDGVDIRSVEEKPVRRFFVNAGIYVLAPEALAAVPPEAYLDMPALFERLKKKGKTIAYPLHEYWIDIGRHEELERAHSLFNVGGDSQHLSAIPKDEEPVDVIRAVQGRRTRQV